MPQTITQNFWMVTFSSAPAFFQGLQIERLTAWLRKQPDTAYTAWRRAGGEGPVNKFYQPILSLLQFMQTYGSNEYDVMLDNGLWPTATAPNTWSGWATVPPGTAFDGSTLGTMSLISTDSVYFPALSLVLLDYVLAWIEDVNRSVVASLTQANSGNWRLQISFAADSSSRWPNAFNLDITRPYASVPVDVDVPLNIAGVLYEASFKDFQGKPFVMPFRVRSRTDAMRIANEIAGQSDGQWTGLELITQLVVPSQDANGDPVYSNFNQAPGSGSDVQKKGRAIYRTAIAGDAITVEIPSVVSSLVTKNSPTSSSDPLDGDTRAFLLSENGAAATALQQVRWGNRNRKK